MTAAHRSPPKSSEVTPPMSVEPSTLERSALERKDREELTTIAQALGAKPPSRARKAEIVELILEVTGVESPASPESDTDDDGRARRRRGARRRGARRRGARGRGACAADAAPVAGDEPAADDGRPLPARNRRPSGRSSSGARPTSSIRPFPARPPETAARRPRPSRRAVPATAPRRPPVAAPRPPRTTAAATARATRATANRPRTPRTARKAGPTSRAATTSAATAARVARATAAGAGAGRRGKDEQGQAEEFSGEPVDVEGLLDLRDEGYGFLRVQGYLPSKDDVYVSVKQVRQFGLRKGDHVDRRQPAGQAQREEPGAAAHRRGQRRRSRRRPAAGRRFEDLTPLFPDEKLRLETDDAEQHDGADHRPASRRSGRASAASSCRRPRRARPRS